MTETELDELAEVAIQQQFHPGDRIVGEGEHGDNLYVVVEGLLEAHREINQRDQLIGVIAPGQAFGEMSLLTGAARGATVLAKTQVFALEIRREDLERIFKARPEIADELGRVMAQRSLETQNTNSDTTETEEEFMDKAKQIAKRISAFFSLTPTN